ncbi:MAG: hypothetical protein QGG40_08205 [Myxococcota bacterium]|nr:hypothetical protein [Myxococcota bacterium]
MKERLASLLREHGVTLVVLTVLVGSVLGPNLSALTDHFLGLEYVDHYGTQWFYWYVEHTVERRELPGHTDLFFFPFGKDIFGHTGSNVLDAYLAVPFRALLGPVLGYNIFVLCGLTATAWAFSLFARQLTEDRVAVGVASVLLAFSPYTMLELTEGRPTQAILLFPALFLHFTWRMTRRTGWRDPLCAGITLALCGYQYWFYAFFGGFVALAHGLWTTFRPPEGSGGRGAVFGRHVFVACLAVALTLPVGLPLLLAASGEGTVPGLLDTSAWSLHSSIPVTHEEMTVGLYLWQPLRLASGFFVVDPDGAERFLERQNLTSLALLPLLLVWLWRPGRLQRGPVLAMAGASMLLATGPVFIVDTVALPNPVYIFLSQVVGFLRRLWWPGRAYVFLCLLGAGVVAVVLAWIRTLQVQRLPPAIGSGPRLQAIACIALAGLWSLDLRRLELAPMDTWSAAIPDGYQCLATGEEGAIIELPFGWTQAHLYYQSVHHRPLFGGMIEDNPVFAPTESLALRDANSFLRFLLALSKFDRTDEQWTAGDRDALKDMGYRYVVLQRDALFVTSDADSLLDDALKTRRRRIRKKLIEAMGRPVFSDARLDIFAPWGDPAPCDPETLGSATETAGRTDLDPMRRVVGELDEQVLTRPMGSDSTKPPRATPPGDPDKR